MLTHENMLLDMSDIKAISNLAETDSGPFGFPETEAELVARCNVKASPPGCANAKGVTIGVT